MTRTEGKTASAAVKDILLSNPDGLSQVIRAVMQEVLEAEERAFWETHDSAGQVDWSKAERARLPNLKPSLVSISLRLPQALLERIKIAAARRDVPYQSLIKVWLAEKAGSGR